MKKKQRSGVEIVRQKGGDCLESVRQRVRVVREEDAGGVMEVMDLEAEQRTRVRDQRAVAEVRGREAEARLARDHWLEDKLTQAEVERKESVRLMEMLRSARVISEARSGEDKNEVVVRRSDGVTANKQHDVRKETRIPVEVEKVTNPTPSPNRLENLTLRDDTIYIRNRAEAVMQRRDVDTLSRKVASLVDEEGSQEKSTTQTTQKLKPILITSKGSKNKNRNSAEGKKETSSKDSISPAQTIPSIAKETRIESKNEFHDDPESMSGLSTILEVTENMSSSRQPGVTEEASPFPQSELLSQRSAGAGSGGGGAEMDLVAVRRLIDRVKKQGEQIKLTDAHYLNVTGTSVGASNKAVDDTDAGGKKYEVNQDFIEKVLNFSSSQSLTLSSDESSVFRPVKLPSPKTVQSSDMKPLQPQKLPKKFFEKSILSPIPKTESTEKNQGLEKVSMFKPVESPKISQSLSHSKAFSKRNEQLRYYILKLLQMKHDEVDDLSVTSTENSTHEVSKSFYSRLGDASKSSKYNFSSSCDNMKTSTNSSRDTY